MDRAPGAQPTVEEWILDSSGNGLHGTPFRRPTYRAVDLPFSSTAMEFDGIIDEVRISNVALLPSQFLNVVPEPSVQVLLFVGIAGLGFAWKRSRRALAADRVTS